MLPYLLSLSYLIICALCDNSRRFLSLPTNEQPSHGLTLSMPTTPSSTKVKLKKVPSALKKAVTSSPSASAAAPLRKKLKKKAKTPELEPEHHAIESDEEGSVEHEAHSEAEVDAPTAEAEVPSVSRTKKAASVSFDEVGLSPWLVDSCKQLGLLTPTPIQAACIRPALAGQDILGSAETGSGKTAAFVLPMLQALSCDPYGVMGLILSPARELASQIADQVSALGSGMGVNVVTIVGGHDMMQQALVLAQRPHIVVATPGRLVDHLSSGDVALSLRRLRMLVIDEADRCARPPTHPPACSTKPPARRLTRPSTSAAQPAAAVTWTWTWTWTWTCICDMCMCTGCSRWASLPTSRRSSRTSPRSARRCSSPQP